MKNSENGNAVILILIGICLFGALAFTFMQGSKSGQGNLTAQQSKIAAQEMLDFFTAVDRAANKLRQKGCSQSDISFANPKDTGPYITNNDSVTAPLDKSCHIFDPAGGGLTMNMDWTRYQWSLNSIPVPQQTNHGNILFKYGVISIQDIGTSAPEMTMSINYIQRSICDAYNLLLNQTIALVADADPLLGDENPSLAGKHTFCRSGYQINYVWLAR